MKSITFGTDGWRGTMDADFNDKNVAIVAQAICNHLYTRNFARKGCIVAYDTRANSDHFADLVAKVLANNGIAAWRMETFCPTPQAAFGVRHMESGGAIMITASHNPPHYNGIKFIPHYGGPATPDITEDIEWEIQNILELGTLEPPEERSIASTRTLDVSNAYIDQLIGLTEKIIIERAKPRVLFDPMFGAGQ
ncbi:MAG: phosphoglucomutase/phosphomannomutase family protein, partial [Actinomycetota bacterium]|nr:phosphoglucomutase/phosphomannomutase family protein [Actinomycetota bacterium]